MRMSDMVNTALSSLARTKSRSMLTILGIVIGIGAVILMLSIGRGAEGLILNQVADLGSDLVFVEPSSGDPTSGPPNPFIEQTVNMDDIKALKRSGLFSAVSASLITTLNASYEETNDFFQIVGTDPDQLKIFPADLLYGDMFEDRDVDGYSRVVVLGLETSQDLFGDRNPVGEKVKIKQAKFRVVGVFEEQGSRFFQNLDQRIYMPVTTLQRDIMGVDHVSFISALAEGDIELAKDEVRWILRDTHNIDNPEGLQALDDFFVSSQTDAEDVIGVVGSVLTILLSSIAAISLIVGGIGIMNIMLVSVSERTKEIGLRKAVGATNEEILQQFLIEAIILTMIGGLMGIIGGATMSLLIGFVISNFFLDTWTTTIPLNGIILSAVVSTVVGLVFGIYPAKSASRLDPIEALRYE